MSGAGCVGVWTEDSAAVRVCTVGKAAVSDIETLELFGPGLETVIGRRGGDCGGFGVGVKVPLGRLAAGCAGKPFFLSALPAPFPLKDKFPIAVVTEDADTGADVDGSKYPGWNCCGRGEYRAGGVRV